MRVPHFKLASLRMLIDSFGRELNVTKVCSKLKKKQFPMLQNRQFVNGRLKEKESISKEIMFYEEITLLNYLMHRLCRKIRMKIYYYWVELKG